MRGQKQLDDSRVAGLLEQVTENVPGDLDLRPRVRRRLAASHHGESSQPTYMLALKQRQFAPRWGYLMGSVIVIVGLLLSAFAFARPLIFSWLGDNGLHGISLANAPLINRSATSQGITVEVEQVYADAARTAVTTRIQAPQNGEVAMPRLDQTYLLDSRGWRYPALTGLLVSGEGLLEFAPLPDDALTARQDMTLVVQAMFPGSGKAPVAGPWQISFQIAPQAARAITLTAPPMTQGGVTVQPERLDLSPAGARLLLRISGLAADTSLLDAAHVATHDGDTIVGCPPNSHSCASSGSTGDGALLRLQGSDGQVLEPSWTLAIDPATPGVGILSSASQLVGPGGVAEIEVLFATPLHATSGTVHLTIDHFPLKSSHRDANGNEQMASGPWTFTLRLP